jgi:hypothetical protein
MKTKPMSDSAKARYESIWILQVYSVECKAWVRNRFRKQATTCRMRLLL